MKDEPKMS